MLKYITFTIFLLINSIQVSASPILEGSRVSVEDFKVTLHESKIDVVKLGQKEMAEILQSFLQIDNTVKESNYVIYGNNQDIRIGYQKGIETIDYIEVNSSNYLIGKGCRVGDKLGSIQKLYGKPDYSFDEDDSEIKKIIVYTISLSDEEDWELYFYLDTNDIIISIAMLIQFNV